MPKYLCERPRLMDSTGQSKSMVEAADRSEASKLFQCHECGRSSIGRAFARMDPFGGMSKMLGLNSSYSTPPAIRGSCDGPTKCISK